MQVNLNSSSFTYGSNFKSSVTDKDNTQLNANMSLTQVSNSYFLEFSKQISNVSSSNFNAQSGFFGITKEHIPSNLAEILKGIDYNAIGYKGADISSLSKEEASDLISENGFFGIAQTSQRIADFVLAGAGDDVKKLKAGKEGVLRGFEEARKIWGGKLPDISEKTIEKSIKAIDEKLSSLGEKIVNVSA